MRAHRLPILLAIACALFLRAWVPVGWMPAANGGAFAIEPCPAADPAPMAHMAGHHGAKHDPSDHADHGHCAFAPLQVGFASADLQLQLPATSQSAEPIATDRRGPLFKTGPPALPPPATGPPPTA